MVTYSTRIKEKTRFVLLAFSIPPTFWDSKKKAGRRFFFPCTPAFDEKGVGRVTQPLDCLSSPLAEVTLNAHSAIPERASLFRKAEALEVAFRVASAWRGTSRKPSIPCTGGTVVTKGVSQLY